MWRWICCNFVIFLLVLQSVATFDFGSLEHQSIDRMVDLSTQLAKYYIRINVSNIGTDPVRYYYVTVEGDDHLALIEAKDENHRELKVKKVEDHEIQEIQRKRNR